MENPGKRTGGKRTTDKDHGQRHAGISHVIDEFLHIFRQRNARYKQYDCDERSQHAGISKDLAKSGGHAESRCAAIRERAADQRNSISIYDEVKHEHVDGDVNNILRAKQGTYDRNAHKTAVRKQCQQFVDWGRLTRWSEDKYDKKSGEEKKQVKNADKNQIFPK